jgi:hypothetical protein
MRYEGKSYYKIGRTRDLGGRESELRVANPFIVMIAKKYSLYSDKEEKEIHKALKDFHFDLEWFELKDEQYKMIFNTYQFEEYSPKERIRNLTMVTVNTTLASNPDEKKHHSYHVFKKPKKLKNGKTVHRWYYYYIDEAGKQVQKACKKCNTRAEAEDYIRELAID